MKILHLPFNIASQISITVRGLRALGLDARGLARRISHIQDYSGIEAIDWFGKPNPAARLARGLRWRLKMVRAMAWADVIHWHWGDTTWRGLDLRIAAWLGKPRLVEFWGDDIRDPQRASCDNPFIARMYEQNPELACSHSHAAQSLFKRHGFECLIPGYELSDYLEPNLFARYHQTRACLVLDDYQPRYPDASKLQPLVVHAPSHKSRKGTEAVLEVVSKLSKTHRFEFKLIHDMPRRDALELVAQCDLFLDQFTIGAEGLAAHEAMALGKPVMCYIKPSVRARYSDDLPIIVADQLNLEETLGAWLNDGAGRHEAGRLGRAYVARHHDAKLVAAGLVEIYQELLSCARGSALVGASA